MTFAGEDQRPSDGQRVRAIIEAEERREDIKQRLEREHHELLEELRALIPGAEVLFGLLLAVRFTELFADLGRAQVYVYYATLVCTSVALVLFLAPAAHHRVSFRTGDKEYMLRKGNREAIAGSLAISLAFTGVLYLVTDLVFDEGAALPVAAVFFLVVVWRWWALAVYRRHFDRPPARWAPPQRRDGGVSFRGTSARAGTTTGA